MRKAYGNGWIFIMRFTLMSLWITVPTSTSTLVIIITDRLNLPFQPEFFYPSRLWRDCYSLIRQEFKKAYYPTLQEVLSYNRAGSALDLLFLFSTFDGWLTIIFSFHNSLIWFVYWNYFAREIWIRNLTCIVRREHLHQGHTLPLTLTGPLKCATHLTRAAREVTMGMGQRGGQ